MFKSPAVNGILLLLLGAAFVGAFVLLLRDRFAAGDIYSEYSSFRADPRGASVLYEAIDRLPETSSRRNSTAIHRLEGGEGRTVLFAGADPFSGDRLRATEREAARLAEEGSRVAILFAPRTQEPPTFREREGARGEEPDDGGELNDEEPSFAGESAEGVLIPRFGYDLDAGLRLVEYRGDDLPLSPIEKADDGWEVESVPDYWISGLFFDPDPEEWRVLLTFEGRAVLAERAVGEGSVVLMSDAHWVSNEALHRRAMGEFVAWMIGGGREVVFEETHHGVVRRRGVMRLARDFGFTPAVFVLLAAGLLFVWRNTRAFPPRQPATVREDRQSLQGRDTGKGLVNLLRRTIPRKQILDACWKQWKDSQESAVLRRKSGKVREAEALLQAGGHSASPEKTAEMYRRIARVLHQESMKTKR